MIIQGLWESTWTHLPCAHGEGILTSPALLNTLTTGPAQALEEIEGISDLSQLSMIREVELGDGKVEVMGFKIYVDKFLRVFCKAREEVLAPLTSNVIWEGDPIDKIAISWESGEDNIVHVLVSEIRNQ